jgi:short-subunit dehydrogenase
MAFARETIWIIGASSGIGRELAIQLAGLGATLILSARREQELIQLRQKLGENHSVYPLDVADLAAVDKVAGQITAHHNKLDRVLFLPALYKPAAICDMDINFAHKLIDVNLTGAMYVVHAVLPIFARQQSGQLVLCGSVAGYLGLPNGQPYSASKAGLINFAESLYAEAPAYLDVKLINPGFVRTSMTAKNDFVMPMITTVQHAAAVIIRGLTKRAFEIHFPRRFTILLKLLSILPYRLALWLTRKIMIKQ